MGSVTGRHDLRAGLRYASDRVREASDELAAELHGASESTRSYLELLQAARRTLDGLRVLSVLLCDDSTADAELTMDELRGYAEVTHVHTAREAIEAWQGRSWDGVIVDLHLPGSSGLEVIRRIRNAGGDCPVVALTGYAHSDVEDAARRVGASGVAVKGTPRVWDVVRGAIGSRR